MKIAEKKLENIIKEEVETVISEFMSPRSAYVDTAVKIYKMYLEQGVDDTRSRALAVAYYNFLFGSDFELGKISAMIDRKRQSGSRTAVGDNAMKVAENFGSALGHLAYSGIRGAKTAISNLSPSAVEPLKKGMVAPLMDAGYKLSYAIENGKNNAVEKFSLIVANKTNLVLNTIEKSGYPGAEGVGNVFRRAVRNSSSNPSLEATNFSKAEFDKILNDLNKEDKQ
tara:strand:+ start:269 stop:946 length:678 start_codon:yes stop_codon:yes gene_type:complete